MIYAGQNGTTVVTGRFGDVAVSVNVTVENSDKPVLVTDFTNDSDFERALSGVSNLSVSTAALPEGWNSGAAWSFDITNGRLATIDLTFNKTLFGLPESLSFDLDDKDGVVKKVHFFYVDALGKQEMRNVDLADLNTAFADEPMEYYRYPLKLTTMRFTLDTKNVARRALLLFATWLRTIRRKAAWKRWLPTSLPLLELPCVAKLLRCATTRNAARRRGCLCSRLRDK